MSFAQDTIPPPSGPGWNSRRIVFLALSGIALVAILVWASEVLLPFILAVITAYVLTPLVALCERGRIPRSVSILLVYAVTLTTAYLAIAGLAPRIYQETVQLTRETPALARRLAVKWGPVVERRVRLLLDRAEPGVETEPAAPKPAIEIVPGEGEGAYSIHVGSGVDLVRESDRHWRIVPQRPDTSAFSVAELLNDGISQSIAYLKRNALEVIRVGQVIISKVTRGVFLGFMILMVAGYLMHTRDEVVNFLRSLPPPRARPSFDRLLYRIDRGLSGVVRGQLIIMGVNGLLSAIGFWLFGLKYWPILALVAGLMSIIPIFGSILSTIPAVLIGLTQDFWTALWVMLWIIGIHQVEANLLNPNIIGVAAKLHPVLVIFSLVAGEHAYGLWGALLAVPTLSVLQSIFNHFRFESLPDAPPDSVINMRLPPQPPSATTPTPRV